MNKFRKVMIAVVAMALLVMGGTAVLAQTAEGGETDTPLNESQPFGKDGEQGRPPQGDRSQGRPGGLGNGNFIDREAMTEAIAGALGITVEELEAAQEEGTKLPELAESLGVEMETVEAAKTAVRIDGIEQAVADGDLTQEQADSMLEQMELRDVAHDILDRDAMTAVVADVLGMTVAELEAAQEEGTKLPELAEEAGVEMSAVREAMSQAKTDALQDAVDSGLITQEQAYEIANQHGRQQGQRGQGHGGNGCPQGGQGGQGGQGRPQGNGGDFNTAPTEFDG